MKQRIITLTLLLTGVIIASAQTQKTVTVENTSELELKAQPVVVDLKPLGEVKSALVRLNGLEVPCQMDDLDGDGTADELCFLTDLKKKQRQVFSVELSSVGEPRQYEPQVYAEMLLSNKKIKEENKQDLYISSLTVDKGTNPYWQLHHHGPAFENNLVAYRIYFDHRQTVDIYGKYHQGLELRQTQFYPDSLQKATGFGDDVLWVGSTLGLGTLRGWNGQEPVMLEDVAHRTLRIIARGPLRTVVEVIDEGWNAPTFSTPVTMTTRYTLYAGRRDCMVDVAFRPLNPQPSTLNAPLGPQGRLPEQERSTLCTGIINVKNSVEFSDREGLRGCWGTDWPVSAKDSAGHKRETVGLGICIPRQNIVEELPKDKRNYPFVVTPQNDELHYAITFCSDNEDFGYHSADDWFACLKEWKRRLAAVVVVK